LAKTFWLLTSLLDLGDNIFFGKGCDGTANAAECSKVQ
jgi:hypothetical protein